MEIEEQVLFVIDDNFIWIMFSFSYVQVLFFFIYDRLRHHVKSIRLTMHIQSKLL